MKAYMSTNGTNSNFNYQNLSGVTLNVNPLEKLLKMKLFTGETSKDFFPTFSKYGNQAVNGLNFIYSNTKEKAKDGVSKMGNGLSYVPSSVKAAANIGLFYIMVACANGGGDVEPTPTPTPEPVLRKGTLEVSIEPRDQFLGPRDDGFPGTFTFFPYDTFVSIIPNNTSTTNADGNNNNFLDCVYEVVERTRGAVFPSGFGELSVTIDDPNELDSQFANTTTQENTRFLLPGEELKAFVDTVRTNLKNVTIFDGVTVQDCEGLEQTVEAEIFQINSFFPNVGGPTE
ncbi:MAG: hypothetical protein IH874_03680 [Candidatus Dadabacteria bacterium]|nr:hypothetical protein [Candidatus Dadabacteria bacterium]